LKFRRQAPIGHYILDFVCFEKRIIIECDGGQHMKQKEKDEKRDKWFSDRGGGNKKIKNSILRFV